jgi:hypothetical protein
MSPAIDVPTEIDRGRAIDLPYSRSETADRSMSFAIDGRAPTSQEPRHV